MQLNENLKKLKNKADIGSLLLEAAQNLRQAIKEQNVKAPWPLLPDDLHSSSLYLPAKLKLFLQHLIGGSQDQNSLSLRVQRLVDSVGQDLVYGVTCAKVTLPKHILLPYAVKMLTGSLELIKIINHLGHGISYSRVKEVDTALCLHKLAVQSENSIALPEHIKPYIHTTLAWDNIDRLEETLSGGGTFHRVNGIAIQQQVFGPQLPTPSVGIPKEKLQRLETGEILLLPYNAGERQGPPLRKYIATVPDDVECEAYKKNLLWLLARLHSSHNQKVSGWTGFNIVVRDKVDIIKDNVGYLPTINAPATEMATIHEVLVQSKKIMNTLKLDSIVVVFDQAIYAKATEILWKHPEKFKQIVPRLGVFHTICTLLGIIGKR